MAGSGLVGPARRRAIGGRLAGRRGGGRAGGATVAGRGAYGEPAVPGGEPEPDDAAAGIAARSRSARWPGRSRPSAARSARRDGGAGAVGGQLAEAAVDPGGGRADDGEPQQLDVGVVRREADGVDDGVDPGDQLERLGELWLGSVGRGGGGRRVGWWSSIAPFGCGGCGAVTPDIPDGGSPLHVVVPDWPGLARTGAAAPGRGPSTRRAWPRGTRGLTSARPVPHTSPDRRSATSVPLAANGCRGPRRAGIARRDGCRRVGVRR